MAQNHLQISLVIPAYNEQRQLAACLRSVAAQTIAPLEVLVVDNNSSDATAQIAREFPFVTVLTEARRGRVFARNRGFNAARGEIIGRIDADTVLPDDWVARVLAFFEQPGNLDKAWTGGPHFYNVRFPRLVSGVYSLLAFRSNQLLAGSCTLWGSNMALPRAQWRLTAGRICPRADIHEDLDLAIHLHQAGVGITYDPHLKVRTQLRRVRTGRHELWDYLQWWPRTLRVHGRRSWVVCWFFGAFLLYYLTPLLNLAEAIARALGKKPLPD